MQTSLSFAPSDSNAIAALPTPVASPASAATPAAAGSAALGFAAVLAGASVNTSGDTSTSTANPAGDPSSSLTPGATGGGIAGTQGTSGVPTGNPTALMVGGLTIATAAAATMTATVAPSITSLRIAMAGLPGVQPSSGSQTGVGGADGDPTDAGAEPDSSGKPVVAKSTLETGDIQAIAMAAQFVATIVPPKIAALSVPTPGTTPGAAVSTGGVLLPRMAGSAMTAPAAPSLSGDARTLGAPTNLATFSIAAGAAGATVSGKVLSNPAGMTGASDPTGAPVTNLSVPGNPPAPTPSAPPSPAAPLAGTTGNPTVPSAPADPTTPAATPGTPPLNDPSAATPGTTGVTVADVVATTQVTASSIPVEQIAAQNWRVSGPTEKIAGNDKSLPASRTDDAKASAKSFVASDQKGVTQYDPTLGIDVAKTAPTMPAGSTYAHSSAPDPTTALGTASSPTAARPEASPLPEQLNLVSTAHRAVEAVLDVTDRFTNRDQHSVNLQFSVAGADLSVRVELRGGEVRTTFRTDSADLRTALSNEWQTVTSQSTGDRSVRLAPPVFTGSGQSASPFSGDAGQRQQPNSQSGQSGPSGGNGTGLRRGSPSVGAGAVAESSPVPQRTATNSVHLHTLA